MQRRAALQQNSFADRKRPASTEKHLAEETAWRSSFPDQQLGKEQLGEDLEEEQLGQEQLPREQLSTEQLQPKQL